MACVRGAWLIAIAVIPLGACSTEKAADPPPVENIVFIENCPEITMISAFPLQTGIGDSIEVEAAAASPENEDLSYQWSAENGKFARPNSPETTYLCESAGKWTIDLLVFTPRGCQMPASLRVACEKAR